MGFLLSTITCSEATPMAKACGVVLLFGTNQHSGIIILFIELGAATDSKLVGDRQRAKPLRSSG